MKGFKHATESVPTESGSQENEEYTIEYPRDLIVLIALKEFKERGMEDRDVTNYMLSQSIAKLSKPQPNLASKLRQLNLLNLPDSVFKIPESRVGASRERLKHYPKIVKFINAARSIGYFGLVYRKGELPVKRSATLQKGHDNGYFIGGRRPFGFLKDPPDAFICDLKPHPEELLKAEKIIQGHFVDGKPNAQLKEEIGVSDGNIMYVLDNIRLYAGAVKYKDDWNPKGRHKSIAPIKDDFWQAHIEPKLRAPKPLYLTKLPPHPLRGFIRKGREWVHDPTVEPAVPKSPWVSLSVEARVYKVWKLLSIGTGICKTSRLTGFAPNRVEAMRRNPIYANKLETPGKPQEEWEDAGLKPYVPFKQWLDIQKICDTDIAFLTYVDDRLNKMYARLKELLSYIKDNKPTTGQIIKGFSWHWHRQYYGEHLRVLREEGIIAKEGGLRGKWYALPNAEEKLKELLETKSLNKRYF